VRRLGVVEVLPGQGTSKARLMAQLDEMRRRIERLPEPACVLIEESGIVAGVVRHLGTAGNVTGHISVVPTKLAPEVGAADIRGVWSDFPWTVCESQGEETATIALFVAEDVARRFVELAESFTPVGHLAFTINGEPASRPIWGGKGGGGKGGGNPDE